MSEGEAPSVAIHVQPETDPAVLDVPEAKGKSLQTLARTQLAGKSLRWHNLTFNIGDAKILKNVSANVPAGKVCAIMGPSGAGKTSLLNLLAGRVSETDRVSLGGDLYMSGKKVDPSSMDYRNKVAFVTQDDALLITATPREALRFSARLRLPVDTSDEDIEQMCTEMLQALGLEQCADVMIGGGLIPGISGGQRKRTAVGVELVTKPQIVFLDEPTSGLDAYGAYQTTQLMKEVAELGSTVLCTIHQPSSEVFHMFDSLILLKSGLVCYAGPISEVASYFKSAGFPTPEGYNVADHAMFVIQQRDDETLKELGLIQGVLNSESASKGDGLELDRLISKEDLEKEKKEAEQDSEVKHDVAPGAGFCTQLAMLTKREFVGMARNKGALIGRFGVSIFLNMLFGIVFFESGEQDDSQADNLYDHVGALTCVYISVMFGSAQPVLLQFPFERPVFIREYSTGTYSSYAYFLAKMAGELPQAFLQQLVSMVMAYNLMGLQGNFFLHVVYAFLLSFASSSVAVVLGSAVADVKKAMELTPIMFVPQLLFSGLFVRVEQVPSWLRWAQYLCSLKYGLNLAYINEFDDCDTAAESNCEALLDTNDVDEDHWYIYLIILISISLILRTAGSFILSNKAKTFY